MAENGTKEMTANERLERFLSTSSDILARQALAAYTGKQFQGERDIYRIFGYKKILVFEDYLAKYERGDVAGRIVDAPAQETWRRDPVISVPDVEERTGSDFLKAWDEIAQRLRIFHYFERVDRIAGIGRYGVLLLGLRDSDNLEMPVDRTNLKPEDLLYVSPFSEGQAEIDKFVEDVTDPRYGQVEFYNIQFADLVSKNARKTSRTKRVHWTRVLHVADDLLVNEVYGRPRLQRVFDRLEDLVKITGGSAEMFWQNVATTWHANLDPELEYDAADLENLEKKFYEMMMGVRRLVQTEGVELEALRGETPNPTGVFLVLKHLIASASEVPQRILFGSEQGQLASGQDMSEWHGRIAGRQVSFAEPTLIRATIDRLAMFGMLKVPTEGYEVTWPEIREQTGEQKADRAKKMAEAASSYAPGNPESVVAKSEFREALGLPADMPEDPEAEEDEEDEDEETRRAVEEELRRRAGQQLEEEV